MSRPALRNLHVPLSEELYDRLREAAKETRKPATVLARQAVEEWLKEREKESLHCAIAAYAARQAGSSADLDEELEMAAVDHLREGTGGGE